MKKKRLKMGEVKNVVLEYFRASKKEWAGSFEIFSDRTLYWNIGKKSSTINSTCEIALAEMVADGHLEKREGKAKAFKQVRFEYKLSNEQK